ncbi:deoxycytidylate deaminase-like [Pundamilia nyererei]|uniref:Deoxycytidylate deaminase n=1 Tax=Pundamilia nyererei TaxID=303518 RepID=A0A9Y6J5V4_9CICH|nr:PREDICTED: deoxycytidylate deaminase-like [Pundamilia nyererei]
MNLVAKKQSQWEQPLPELKLHFLIDTDYFMAVAVLSAQRSKDPNTQVGACLVNQDNKIVGTGHNCMPNGCEGKLPWNRKGDKLDTKYMYVCHAELNAIVNASANADVKGCTMYVTLFPCNECTKLIIQAGLKEVVYLCDKYHNTPGTIASKRMLDKAGIPYRRFVHTMPQIAIALPFIETPGNENA